MKTFLQITAIALTVALSAFIASRFDLGKETVILGTDQCPLPATAKCKLGPSRGKDSLITLKSSALSNKSPFQLEVLLEENLKALSIEAQFIGIGMELNETLNFSKSTDSLWKVSGILPFCTLKKMEWKLILLVETESQKLKFIKNFEVIN
ncbi:MAG: hypothetical protein ACPGJV_05230 [Bacteriovoracaceae bacterium]